MENYLYFAEADVETGDDSASEAITVPASSYLFADPISTTVTNFYFESIKGSDSGMQEVALTHKASENKNVMKAMMACINSHPSKGGFIIVANANAAALTTGTEYNKAFNGLQLSTVAITQDVDGQGGAAVTGVSGGTALWNSYGAGAISTAAVPVYERRVSGNEVVSTIIFDLTALGNVGTAQNDAIGLPAGGAGYIAKYVQSTMGELYKWEAACFEIPGEGTATITTDIDFAFNASATIAYDGAVGTAEINTGGFANVGAGANGGFLGTPTANDYLYIVEGDTAGTTGVYNAGKIMLKLYGRLSTI